MTLSTKRSKEFQASERRTLNDLEAGFRSILRPTPRLTISEWADQYRHLSREDSAEPGKWRTARAEYQRDIMDAVTDPSVREVVVMKGTQVGWTAIIGNVIGYFIDLDPAPMLVLLPTVDRAKEWSKERLAPMLRDTPRLRGKVKDPRSRDSGNTVLGKDFPGGHLAIIGANAPSGLASRPIRVVLSDETDLYPMSAGTEGDPQKLASKRQETFWNAKTLKGSTPASKETSPIYRDWKRSDMRMRYVPCCYCGSFQTLRWEQVKWDKTKDDRGQTVEHRPETAHYQCEHCGELWTDVQRWAAEDSGEWRATAPFRGIAGFYLPQFHSKWVRLADVVQEFLDAQGNPSLLQVWTNTVLGWPWEEKGETVEAEGVRQKVESYGPYDLPDEVEYATAGVDVQVDRLECEVKGWSADGQSWGVVYEVIDGDPAQQHTWDALEEIIFDRYWTESGRLIRVRATCVDYGGHHGAQVGAFAKKHGRRNVYATKGAAGPRLIWPARASKAKHLSSLRVIGVDTAKDAIYGCLKIEDGPGAAHIPPTYDDDWFEQVTVEYVVTRYREGRPYRVWVCPKGRRNEALDCWVLALAARESLRPAQRKPSAIVAESVQEKQQVESAVKAAEEVPQKRQRRVRSKGIRR